MMRLLTLLLFSCCFHQIGLAQFAESMRSGRPGQAIGAYAVGKKVFQVQAGLTDNNFSSENPLIVVNDEEWQHVTVLRYGLTEQLEVSGVLGGQFGDDVTSGINNTQIGLRYNFFGNEGARPAVDLQARLLLPVGKDEIERPELGTRFILGTGNSLTDRLSLSTNLGLTIGENIDPIKFYALALGFSITDDLGAFVEIYDNFQEFGNIEVDFDTGLGYMINNDLKLDVSVGWQDNVGTERNNFFVDFGVSFRFHDRE